MTVTRDQAQILATLAVACRPYRAPTWDHAGVMASIAAVKHMPLPEVVLAVIRAAADRDAQTPGVIPKLTGSHWAEQLKPGLYEPKTWDANEVCTTCSQPRAACEGRPRVADDDHAFLSRAASAATSWPAESLTRIVDDLREQTTYAAPTRAAHQIGEGVGTGAGEGAPRQDTGSAWVTRSADCPEAPAQAHPFALTPDLGTTDAPMVAHEEDR